MEPAKGVSTESTLYFDRDVINSMGARPLQKSLIRKKFLSKTNFQYSQGLFIIIYILL